MPAAFIWENTVMNNTLRNTASLALATFILAGAAGSSFAANYKLTENISSRGTTT